LIHICCAHCAAYTIEHWKQQGHEVGGFWYNPNIHPYMEHQSRLESVKKLAEEKKTAADNRGRVRHAGILAAGGGALSRTLRGLL